MIKIFLIFVVTFGLVFASDYSDWLKSQNSEYQTYKKSIDDEFSDMLKNDWEAFKTMNTPSPYKKPKPKTVPIIKKEIVVSKKDLKTSIKIKPKKIVKKIVEKPKIKVKVAMYEVGFKNVEFSFYNQPINIQYDEKYLFNLEDINKDTISDIWQQLGKTQFTKLTKQINEYSNKYAFNDWAKYLFIHKIGMEIYNDKNNANLFTWFSLVKMGYDTKVGYSKDAIYLLSAVDESLYQIAFFTLKDKKYYILTPKGKIASVGSVYTYPSNYPKANKKLSFSMDNKAINLSTNIKTNNLKFKYFNNKYTIKSQYSQDLINFYKNFPQSEYKLYFNSKKSSSISNSLLLQLKPLVDGKTEIEAVNLLLRFVQTSFAYKTDDEQFRYEKVLFPEETLYYKYSDCEDRSIIFSYLVKNLLGLDVVGLKYSDHLATAVNFSTKINGDNFKYKNKTYTISDPTYINANSGMTMPQYKNKPFTIIK